MSVYVRIPRKPKLIFYWDYYSVATIYNWNQYEVITIPDQYCWNKYSVTAVPEYSWDKHDYYWVPEIHRWNQYNVYLSPSGPEPGGLIGEVTSEDPSEYPEYGADISMEYFYEYIGSYEAYPEKGMYLETLTSTDPNAYPNGIVDGDAWYVYKGQTGTTESKGEYLEQVYDENLNAYPQNGVQIGNDGAYWYEYDRIIDGSIERGEIVGTVSSRNPDEYESGSIYDGLWYLATDNTYEKDQKLGTVSNKNPEAYPINGINSDGYWYVRI